MEGGFLNKYRNRYRNTLILLLAVFLYLSLYISTGHLTIYHITLVTVAILLYLSHSQTRFLLLLILPYIIQNISWDIQRFIPFSFLQPIHVAEPYIWELALFGVKSGQHTVLPCNFLANYDIAILKLVAAAFYGISSFMIPVVTLYFWKKVSLGHSQRFEISFIIMNIFAFLTYIFYPAAAPWYVNNYGLFPPSAPVPGHPGALADVDKILGIPLFTSGYNENPVVFGAIPSMHAGFAALILLYSYLSRKRNLTASTSIYFLAMCFSAVYLQHHYVIDLIIGGAYALIATLITELALTAKVKTFYNLGFKLFFERSATPIFPIRAEKPAVEGIEGTEELA